MLGPNTVACRVNPVETEKTSSFPMEAFERFSKTELLAVVRVMHRILDADRRRDLERIVTDLPTLVNDTETHDGPPEIREEGAVLGERSSTGDRPYHLLNYFFWCLSKAQTKIDSAQVNRLNIDKRSCHLSPRELTVLLWMKEGKTNWEIARIIGLSERTVRFHVGSIFEKLDVTSRTQAVARALGAGLIAS